LAIAQNPGAPLSDEVLNNAASNNPDGFGYAYIDINGVVRRKRSVTFAGLVDEYKADWEENKDSPFIVHFRFATHGENCVKFTHPFKLAGGGAMIHNGVMNLPGLPKDYSDSLYFANNFISKLPSNWYRTEHWPAVLEKFIGTNKVICLYPDAVVILNEQLGDWKDDVWYSNASGTYCKVEVKWPKAQSWNMYDPYDYDDYGYKASEERKVTLYDPTKANKRTEYVRNAAGVFVPADEVGDTDEDDIPTADTWCDFVLNMDEEEARWLLGEAMMCDTHNWELDEVLDTLMSVGESMNYDDTLDNVQLVREALILGQ